MLTDVTMDSSNDKLQGCVHVLDDIMIGEALEIRFQAKQGKPLLSGVELIRQHKLEEK